MYKYFRNANAFYPSQAHQWAALAFLLIVVVSHENRACKQQAFFFFGSELLSDLRKMLSSSSHTCFDFNPLSLTEQNRLAFFCFRSSNWNFLKPFTFSWVMKWRLERTVRFLKYFKKSCFKSRRRPTGRLWWMSHKVENLGTVCKVEDYTTNQKNVSYVAVNEAILNFGTLGSIFQARWSKVNEFRKSMGCIFKVLNVPVAPLGFACANTLNRSCYAIMSFCHFSRGGGCGGSVVLLRFSH